MGYFGAWDGSHADSWSGWDGFAGNMGLLTAHRGKANAGTYGSSKTILKSATSATSTTNPIEAVCASAMSDNGFKKAKAKRTFRPCKDFDLQLHAAMRRPLTTNAFSALQTNDGEEVESPNLTRQVWNHSRPVATRYMAGRPLIQKARPAKLCPYPKASSCGCMGACDEAHQAFDLSKNKATGIILSIFLTTTQNSEISERVKEIREKCQEERREAELEGIDRKGVSGFLSQVMGAAETGWTGWQKMSFRSSGNCGAAHSDNRVSSPAHRAIKSGRLLCHRHRRAHSKLGGTEPAHGYAGGFTPCHDIPGGARGKTLGIREKDLCRWSCSDL